MAETLTGESAALYIGAWTRAAAGGYGLNARRLRHDALLAARRSGGALRRLRLARLSVIITRQVPQKGRSRAFSRAVRAVARSRRAVGRRKAERPRQSLGRLDAA